MSIVAFACHWMVLLAAVPPPGAEASHSRLREQIAHILTETGTPGAGIAIVRRDRGVWAEGVGWADVESRRPATAQTPFRIGSVTKSFVALSVLMLEEEGRLHLEDRVRDVLPDLAFDNPWEQSHPLRIVHLLEHAAGFDDWSFREYASNDPRPLTLSEGLALTARARHARWPPGTMQAYSNAGPPVAAAAVERISGQTFETFVGQRVFAPLGMHASFFPIPGLASLYHQDGRTPFPYWNVVTRPSGAINASAADMAQYLRLFLGDGTVDGKRLLSRERLERMRRPGSTSASRAGLENGYGLGLYADVQDGRVFYGHDGGLEGGLARIAFEPRLGVGYVVLINSDSPAALARISDALRAELLGSLPKPAFGDPVPVPPAISARYSGWWINASPRSSLQLQQELLGLYHLTVGREVADFRSLRGGHTVLIPQGDGRLRDAHEPISTMLLMETGDGPRVATDMRTLRPISAAWAWLWVGALAFVALICLAALPLGAVGALILLRRARRRQLAGLGLWGWSMAAIAGLATMLAPFWIDSEELLSRFGAPNPTTVLMFGGSLVLVVATAVALWKSVSTPWRTLPLLLDCHARATAVACAIAIVYLALHGFIPLRTWAL